MKLVAIFLVRFNTRNERLPYLIFVYFIDFYKAYNIVDKKISGYHSHTL